MCKSRKQIIKNYTVESRGVVGKRRPTEFPSCNGGERLMCIEANRNILITLGVDAKGVDVKINGHVLTRKNGKKTYLLRISER